MATQQFIYYSKSKIMHTYTPGSKKTPGTKQEASLQLNKIFFILKKYGE